MNGSIIGWNATLSSESHYYSPFVLPFSTLALTALCHARD
jgi:hypothetical protein